MSKTSLSIVIPAYNEEVGIPVVLDDILTHMPRYVPDYEVIVVDDGSTDKTGNIADEYARKNKRINVIHKSNGGYNSAMIAGIKNATKEYVGYFQADGQNLVRDFVHCYNALQKYDLVFVGRGKPHDYNTIRLFFHYGGFFLYYMLFGLRYSDPHWVYFWKTKEIQKLDLDPSGGVFLLVESLIKFEKKGLKVKELGPVKYRGRIGGEQKAVKPLVIWRTGKSVIRLWWQTVTGKI